LGRIANLFAAGLDAVTGKRILGGLATWYGNDGLNVAMRIDPIPFDYELPRHLVAQEPLRHRADARLMVVDRNRQAITHHHVRDLIRLLQAGDRLVLNDTKVLPAQLAGRRAQTGGRWQGLFLEATPEGHWRILCKTRGQLTAGEAITLLDREGRPDEKLWLMDRLDEGQWLAHVHSAESTHSLLDRLGRVPLPPYIRGGNMVDADIANYQTVFARHAGAIAAPTAGLHFTKELLKALEARDVSHSYLTLHVGLGTFRPIDTATLDEHHMHSEWGEITQRTAEELNATRAAGGRLIAVGTTVTRLLETAARATGPRQSASTLARSAIPAWRGTTDLFVRPPFEFQATDALMTNFHFPRTTLLVLVQTFGGRELIVEAYRQAIREEYRFYSYGDAMLIV
jgi:S-adenosylmethionine:tRNA ribosyltransferase-isomerase